MTGRRQSDGSRSRWPWWKGEDSAGIRTMEDGGEEEAILSELEVCWLVRLAMACAFVHVVDENEVTSDKRANHLTDELKEAVSGFELYAHGCCGGQRRQRAAMWRHVYGLNNDDAHAYEVNYCAARSFAETTDKEKLKVARVYLRDGKDRDPKRPFPSLSPKSKRKRSPN